MVCPHMASIESLIVALSNSNRMYGGWGFDSDIASSITSAVVSACFIRFVKKLELFKKDPLLQIEANSLRILSFSSSISRLIESSLSVISGGGDMLINRVA